MDGLSTAASIAGLVQLSAVVFQGLRRYARDVKDAKQRATELEKEVMDLSGILHKLSLLAADMEGHWTSSTFKAHGLHACRTTLRSIDRCISKATSDFESGRKRDVIFRSLTWPFSKHETQELLDDLARHKTDIGLALSADTMDALLQCLSKQSGLATDVKDVKTAIQQRFEADEGLRSDEKRGKIIKFFSKINPLPYLRTALSLRQAMTGLWLLDHPVFREWMATRHSKLWLKGIPGSGKTVLCGATIEHVLEATAADETVAVAFFFCDYRRPETQNLATILSSIAAQLALRSDGAFDLLQAAYHECHPKSGLERSPEPKRLCQMIQTMSKEFQAVYIVVDGIDECGIAMHDVANSMRITADQCRQISMALFSRDEEDIREALAIGFESIEIAAHTEDLELYVGAQMAQKRQLKNLAMTSPALNTEIRQSLIHGANGMFRWVACQLDYLDALPTNKSRRLALKKLPPTLNETYERILQDILVKSHDDPHIKTLIQRALWWIGTAYPPLTIPELCEGVSLEADDDLPSGPDSEDVLEEGQILRLCSSLIRKSHDGKRFEFAHFTVHEYLRSIKEDSGMRDFRLSTEEAACSLAATSLRFLMLREFNSEPTADSAERDRMKDKAKRHPFYHYAALGWFDSIDVHVDSHPELRTLVTSFLNLRHASNCVSWVAYFIFHCARVRKINPDEDRDILSALLRPGLSPLHLSAFLGLPEISRLLIDCGADVNARCTFGSPLHFALIGPSMFLRWQELSTNWQSWRRHNLDIVETVNILLEHGADARLKWDGCSSPRLALEWCTRRGKSDLFLQFINHRVPLDEDVVELFRYMCDDGIRGRYSGPGLLDSKYSKDSGSFWGGNRNNEHTFIKEIVSGVISATDHAPGDWPGIAPLVSIAQKFNLATGEHGIQNGSLNFASTIADADFSEALELAIKFDKCKEVADFLADPRFCFEGMLGGGQTILHRVAYHSAERVMEALAEKKFDLECRDQNGDTPILLCRMDESQYIVELLLGRGAVSTACNKDGQTIWHRAAEHDLFHIMDVLLQKDIQANRNAALKMVTKAGRTPLSTALYHGSKKVAFLILQNCQPELGYVMSDIPVLELAIRIGSESLFKAVRAFEDGSVCRFTDGSTPLHHVLDFSKPKFIKYLATSYDIHARRSDGLFPIETVLANLRAKDFDGVKNPMNRLGMIREFMDESIVTAVSTEGRDLWKLWCMTVSRLRQKERVGVHAEYAEGLTKILIEEGALSTYEERYHETGVLPLINAALIFEPGFEWCDRVAWMWPALKAAISKSRLFSEAASHPSVLRLAEGLVNDGLNQQLKFLLDRGFSLHYDIQVVKRICYANLSAQTFRFILSPANEKQLEGVHLSGEHFLRHLIESRSVSNGYRDKIEHLLFLGVSPNTGWKTPEGLTKQLAVVHAAALADFDTVNMLLNHGAHLDESTSDEPGVLGYASMWGDVAMIKRCRTLLGPDFNWGETRSGMTLHDFDEANYLQAACCHGNIEAVKYFLEEGLFVNSTNSGNLATSTDINWALPNLEWTALHLAAWEGKNRVVEVLLEKGANFNVKNRDGDSPIDCALFRRNSDVVKTLSRYGARASIKHDGAESQESQLANDSSLNMAESRLGQVEMSFEIAMMDGDLSRCKCILLESGKDLVNCRMPSCHSCPPLLRALVMEKDAIIHWLLLKGASAFGIFCRKHEIPKEIDALALRPPHCSECLTATMDMYLRNRYCWMKDRLHIIHTTVARGDISGLEIILKHIETSPGEYRSLLTQVPNTKIDWNSSAAIGDGEISRFILCHPTNLPPHHPSIHPLFSNIPGITPLHIACLMNNFPVAQWLIKHGADTNAPDGFGRSPLTVAAMAGDQRIVMHLADNGAHLDMQDHDGVTALGHAVASGQLEIVEFLANRNADLEICFSQHETTLMQSMKCPKTFLFLLDKGLYPFQQEASGATAIHWGLNVGSPPLRTLLLNSPSLVLPLGWDRVNILTEIRLESSWALRLLRRLPPQQRHQVIHQAAAATTEGGPGCSPLCVHSQVGAVSMMEVLLRVDAEIETECLLHGTPVMAAARCGRLELLKVLVRRGARTGYDSSSGTYRTAVYCGRRHPHVVRWLVVERFTEQLKLSEDAFPLPDRTAVKEIKPWSGLVVVEFPLAAGWRKRWDESSEEYAARLQRLRKTINSYCSVALPEGKDKETSEDAG
ncbi:ankyrin repeat-containing domain protein [Podospora didyma]|uniref:Ankyrin repeat-containing domain protein n=1 Tax=Podospora didyma TaxID=330526 RepID=A0AAE0N721_9PEZI|nr:ankyrin repeat-containing domain protein [Podospora didyma]